MQQLALIEHLVDRLKYVDGLKAIVLGGSYASGAQKPDSDIDIAIYYKEDQPLDIGHIRTIASKLNDMPNPVVTDLGGWGPWVNGGAWLTIQGQRVDFLYRNVDRVSQVLDACNNGEFETDYLQQPPYGFYSYIYCAETQVCKSLYDPDGLLQMLKAKVSHYPNTLKQAIFKHNLWSAGFSLENAKKPAGRGDIYFTAGCVTRAVSMLVQVLYALNETYFLSEKGLSKDTSGFKIQPDNFLARIDAILSNIGHSPSELKKRVLATETLREELLELSGRTKLDNHQANGPT